MTTCVRCEHALDVHWHYRPGHDCSLCPCPTPPVWQRLPHQVVAGLTYAGGIGYVLLVGLARRVLRREEDPAPLRWPDEYDEHGPMPIDANGDGPADQGDTVAVVCWCGVPDCGWPR